MRGRDGEGTKSTFTSPVMLKNFTMTGTTIKDTWTKPRQVEAGEGGELAGVEGEWCRVNADFCS